MIKASHAVGAVAIAIALVVCGALPGAAPALAGPAEAVTVVKQVWKKPGRNNAGVADITLRNGNDVAVKDVRLKCVFTTARTGKVTEIQQTIAGPLKAKAEQTFKKISFGFVDTSASDGACTVVSVTPM
jgi:hypothetical protein